MCTGIDFQHIFLTNNGETTGTCLETEFECFSAKFRLLTAAVHLHVCFVQDIFDGQISPHAFDETSKSAWCQHWSWSGRWEWRDGRPWRTDGDAATTIIATRGGPWRSIASNDASADTFSVQC